MKELTRCRIDGKKFDSWSALSVHTIDEHRQIAVDIITVFLVGGDLQ